MRTTADEREAGVIRQRKAQLPRKVRPCERGQPHHHHHNHNHLKAMPKRGVRLQCRTDHERERESERVVRTRLDEVVLCQPGLKREILLEPAVSVTNVVESAATNGKGVVLGGLVGEGIWVARQREGPQRPVQLRG